MGKHKDDLNQQSQQAQPIQQPGSTFPPVTQEQVDESLKPKAELPPQGSELRAAQSLLGKAVRTMVGAHVETVILTDFETDSYHGIAIRCRSMDTKDRVPVIDAVHGLRPYPYKERPLYQFQFVMPGEDESVLINIANEFLKQRQNASGQEANQDAPTNQTSGNRGV